MYNEEDIINGIAREVRIESNHRVCQNCFSWDWLGCNEGVFINGECPSETFGCNMWRELDNG